MTIEEKIELDQIITEMEAIGITHTIYYGTQAISWLVRLHSLVKRDTEQKRISDLTSYYYYEAIRNRIVVERLITERDELKARVAEFEQVRSRSDSVRPDQLMR